MISTYRKIIREHCPNNPTLRRVLAYIRINAYEKSLLSERIVNQCIQDDQKKKKIVAKYRRKWPKRAKNVLEEAKLYAIPDYLLDDVLFANFAYGMRAEEFMYYDFANKSECERSEFLSDIKYSELTVRMNNMFDADVFYNKARAFSLLEKYYHRDALPITKTTTISEIKDFIF